MSHVNAALTPRHRLTVARLVVDEAWPISEVAARFQVSWPTVKRRGLLHGQVTVLVTRPDRPVWS